MSFQGKKNRFHPNPRMVASEKVAGLCQYATAAQVQAGTRADRSISPSHLSSIEPSDLASEGFILYADVTLTSTEVKALAATQQTLVAAPGAGNVLVFKGALLKLDYGGTNAFTESSITFGVKYTDDSGAQVSQTIEATGWIDQTADTYTNAEPKIDAIVAAAGAENQALVIDNLGGGEVAGNAANDNTVVIRTFYQIVSI